MIVQVFSSWKLFFSAFHRFAAGSLWRFVPSGCTVLETTAICQSGTVLASPKTMLVFNRFLGGFKCFLFSPLLGK